MNDSSDKQHSPKKSDLCFPLTDAVRTWNALQEAQEAVYRRFSARLAEWGLSIPKYVVLLQLYNHESLRPSKIGDLVSRCDSNLTTLIDRMERDELVEKTHHATDRRVKEILLTTKGREIAPQVIKAARQFLDELISTILSEEEQKALIQMLRRITVLIP